MNWDKKLKIAYNGLLLSFGYILYIIFVHHDKLYMKDLPLPLRYALGAVTLFVLLKAWHFVEVKARLFKAKHQECEHHG